MPQRKLKLSIIADDDDALTKALGYAVGRIAVSDEHADYEFGDSSTTFEIHDEEDE